MDFRDWEVDSPLGESDWIIQGDQIVSQELNGLPTVFYSDFSSLNKSFSGNVSINGLDDDYVGFVLGYQPGSLLNDAGDSFLLIDWRAGFQVLRGTDSLATPGLTASIINPGTDRLNLWEHSFPLEEIGRGLQFGEIPYLYKEYEFEIAYTESSLRLWIDDQLELDLQGDFADGRFGFYNFSQPETTYQLTEVSDLTASTSEESIPDPGLSGVWMIGMLAVFLLSNKTPWNLRS